MNYNEFADSIKAKYPQYADMDNRELAQKMVAKYPEYNDVTFDDAPLLEGKVEKGIDLTPSGLMRGARALGGTLPNMIFNKENPIEAFKTAYNTELENKNKFIDGLTDLAGYTAIPVSRAGAIGAYSPMLKTASNASKLAKTGTFLGNAAIQGGVPGTLEALKEGDNALKGAGAGTGIAAATMGAMNSIPYIGKPLKTAIANPSFQKGLSNSLEALTSVPSEYSNLALKNELAGNSIFKGKFDADTAYQPIERQLREAKNMLPTREDFAGEFYKLGIKATEGMNAIKEDAASKISEVLGNLNNREVQNNGLQNAVNSVINRFGEGGIYNSAKRNAPRVMNLLNDTLPKEGLTLRDLHRIKGDLYDIGYKSAELKEGTQAEVARGTAEQINNYLRGVAPEYIAPNDKYSLIADIERGLDNENTIAKKIRDIGSEGNILSGMDQRLKDIDNLLPKQNKFYNQAKEVIESQEEIDKIRKAIGPQYERNPRLLANRTDESFEQALQDLQTKTNINFMDELEKIRAREALEKWFPGQGGGSGSSQGFGNLLRTAIIGGSPAAALLTHNPLVGLGAVASVSPKIMAQGTIKNLGKLYNALGKEIPQEIQRFITPATVMGASPLLYGEVSNY